MIEIKEKDEISIPFEKIGDRNWVDKTKLILTELAENFGNELPVPVSAASIAKLETRIDTNLPEGLKLFYEQFGIADIGEQLQELDEIDWIGNTWKEHPEYGPDFSEKDKEYMPFLVSFSDYIGNGNMFCFHSETKEIYYFDHDTKPYFTKLFDDVSDYIKGCLISCQSELFHQETGQEQVEEWCEEILDDMYGEETVEKWKY